MTNKHLPGPWMYYRPSEYPNSWRIACNRECKDTVGWYNYGYVCRVKASHQKGAAGGLPPQEADVRLMASAPELLAALEKCVGLIERDYAGFDAIAEWQDAVEAINYAKGNNAQ